MSSYGIAARDPASQRLMHPSQPVVKQGAGLTIVCEFETPDYGSAGSRTPEIVISSPEATHPLARTGAHPLTHSPGMVYLRSAQVNSATFNPDHSPLLSPSSSSLLISRGGAGVQELPAMQRNGGPEGPGAASQGRGTSAPPSAHRSGSGGQPGFVSPETYLLHLDAEDTAHVERFEQAVASVRQYSRLAVPTLIASGATALFSAFHHMGDADENLRLWFGVIGLTGIGAGIGLAYALSGLTRVYDAPQPARHDAAAHVD